MTLGQSFLGSVIENCAMLLIMSLFSPAYAQRKWKLILAGVIVALVATCGEYWHLALITRYIVNYGFSVILYSILFRRKVWCTLFEFIFAMVVVIGIEFLLIMIQNYLLPEKVEVWHTFVHLFVLLCICLSLTSCHQLIIKFQAFYDTYRQIIYFVTISIFAILFTELFLWNSAGDKAYDSIGTLSLFTIMWVALNVYLLKVLIADGRKKAMVNAYKQYEEMTKAILDCLYTEKHEYNRHLQAILQLCETKESTKSQIIDYIVQIREKNKTANKIPNQLQRGSGFISGLIYAKQKEAEISDIKLIYIPKKDIPLFPCHNYELVEILGNLIDNGLEYLKEQNKSKEREVYVELGFEKKRVFIKVKNSFAEENPETENFVQKGYTTKEGSGHGYGLYNVKQIVKKYRGEFQIFVDDENLCICIYFNNSDGQLGSP